MDAGERVTPPRSTLAPPSIAEEPQECPTRAKSAPEVVRTRAQSEDNIRQGAPTQVQSEESIRHVPSLKPLLEATEFEQLKVALWDAVDHWATATGVAAVAAVSVDGSQFDDASLSDGSPSQVDRPVIANFSLTPPPGRTAAHSSAVPPQKPSQPAIPLARRESLASISERISSRRPPKALRDMNTPPKVMEELSIRSERSNGSHSEATAAPPSSSLIPRRRPSLLSCRSALSSSMSSSGRSQSKTMAATPPPVPARSRQPSIFGRDQTLDVYRLEQLNLDTLLRSDSGSVGISRSASKALAVEEEPGLHPMPEEEPGLHPMLPIDFSRLSIKRASACSDVGKMKSANTAGSMGRLRSEHDADIIRASAAYQVDSSVMAVDGTAIVSMQRGLSGTLLSLLLRMPHAMLCFFGVLHSSTGVCAAVYANVVLLAATVAVAYVLIIAAVEGPTERYLRLSEACRLLSGFLGLASLRWRSVSQLLGPHRRMLETYAANQGFLEMWLIRSFRCFLVVVALWLYMLLSPTAAPVLLAVATGEECGEADRQSSPVGFSLFLTFSGLCAALSYCQLHVCCGLELMVDTFCVRFFEDPDFEKGVCEWNVLQAILRRTAHTIETCVLSVHTAATAAVAFQAAALIAAPRDGCSMLSFVMALPPLLLMVFCLFRAAAVTEKCSRTPALVNSLVVEEDVMDDARQYLVQYIEHSAAGFYIKGVRLTTFAVLKVTYLMAILLFTFLTQITRTPAD